ncbi:FeoA family protein [Methanothermus fervidus DSM 2088]|uniref:FeoA family protein n=1 Tax=Methanothermus fervidus (strain ATCC 43054 / DSM 2088 / JCM 10308 / V24 S) TaxID=523846 RepID=E3GW24_METFV|nr:FeoA domain-containing protein [Methanothermus fervidus]ADP77789.1 FeoA family protein [Methanothermus fervidus DSM 2088]
MLVTNVKPKEEYLIEKIDGGNKIKKFLKKFGIEEGKKIKIIATKSKCGSEGPLLIKTNEKNIVIGRGWAEKIYVETKEKICPLSRLNMGEKGRIRTIMGSRTFNKRIARLGISEGMEVLVDNFPDVSFVLKINGKKDKITLDAGEASKILIEKNGEKMQLTQLQKNQEAKVHELIAGTNLLNRFKEMGIEKGKKIKIINKKDYEKEKMEGSYFLVKVNGDLVTLSQKLAEKIHVK